MFGSKRCALTASFFAFSMLIFFVEAGHAADKIDCDFGSNTPSDFAPSRVVLTYERGNQNALVSLVEIDGAETFVRKADVDSLSRSRTKFTWDGDDYVFRKSKKNRLFRGGSLPVTYILTFSEHTSTATLWTNPRSQVKVRGRNSKGVCNLTSG